jgi:26S proteasome regulatory subunit N7
MADEVVLPNPNSSSRLLHTLVSISLSHLHENVRTNSFTSPTVVFAKEMAPHYRLLTSTPALSCDKKAIRRNGIHQRSRTHKLDERLAEEEKTGGESEISDAIKAKANYLIRIGDKVRYPPYPNLFLPS